MDSNVETIDFNDAAKRVGKARVRESVQAAIKRGRATEHNETAGAYYQQKDDGVYFFGVNNEGERQAPKKICSRLNVEAMTRNNSSEEWGWLLSWPDADGELHRWAAPAALLVGEPREFVKQLAAGGVWISTAQGTTRLVVAYITQERIEARARSVSASGWHQATYVLPTGESFGADTDVIVYQHGGALLHHYEQAGTLEEWKDQVAARCRGNSRLLLAVSTMFAGPLLHFTGTTGGGFHFVGSSSSGKSTALRVAASVAGAADYVREWRSTANGLEGLAVLHNDATLILDELAQIDPRQAGDAAYLLANGSGKVRMNKETDVRAAPRWCTLVLSAGEIGLGQHMAEAGKKVRAGQAVRLADVPADVESGHGIFDALHDAADGAAMSAALKEAAERLHGSPWPLWLQHLTSCNGTELAASIRKKINEFHADYVPADAVGEVQRVADRFALVAFAGELATACQYQLTGWGEGEATAGAAKCFEAWLHQRGGAGSAEITALLARVRSFFELHGESRLERLGRALDAPPVINRAGFRRVSPDGYDIDEYLVLPEVFENEICAGLPKKRACAALLDVGWLQGDGHGKSSQSIRIPALGGPARVYAFDPRKIHSDDHQEFQNANASPTDKPR